MNEFKVIKSKAQHREYVSVLRNLWKNPTAENEDARELLEVLIEKWEHDTLKHKDTHPIELLKYLMENHNMNPTQLHKELGITKGTMSKILNCRKGLSKHVIRRLAEIFSLSQEVFNRTYPLEAETKKVAKKRRNKVVKKVKGMKSAKKLQKA